MKTLIALPLFLTTKMRLVRALLAAALCIAATTTGLAYTLKPPVLMVVASPDGNALLRIEPGTWLPKAGEVVQPAYATVFRYDTESKAYRITKKFALRNPVSPTDALISNDAEFIITFDDWDPDIGCTPNVVVMYRGSGELVKTWSLEDIFSPEEIKKFGPFPINAPVRRWRGDKVFFVGDSKTVHISHGRDLPWQMSLRLNLLTLTFDKRPEPPTKASSQ